MKVNVKFEMSYLKLLVSILVCYCILGTIAMSIKSFLSLDMVESLYWGREMEMGYYKHPPFYAWLANIWMLLFGYQKNLWAFNLLSMILKSIGAFYVFLLGKKILQDEQLAFWSAIINIGNIYFVSQIRYNANTLLIALWPVLIYYFYLVVFEKKQLHLITIAILGAILMLSKYYTALLLFSMLGYIIYEKKGREIFKMWGFYLISIPLFIALTIPHLLWIKQTNFLIFEYLKHQYEKANPLLFAPKTLITNILFNILLFIVLVTTKAKIPKKSFTKQIDEKAKFLFFTCLGPIVLTYIYIFIKTSAINVYWMSSCFEVLPILAFHFFKPQINQNIVKKIFTFYFAIIFIILFTAHFMENIMEYNKTNDFKSNVHEIMKNENIHCITGQHSKSLGVAFLATTENLPSVYLFIEDKRVFPSRDLQAGECEQKCLKINSNYQYQLLKNLC